jgi:hypothetical protein
VVKALLHPLRDLAHESLVRRDGCRALSGRSDGPPLYQNCRNAAGTVSLWVAALEEHFLYGGVPDGRRCEPLPPSRNNLARLASFSRSVVSHSHIVSTAQPKRLSARRVIWSRVLFRVSLESQYVRRLEGIRHRPQVCMCQKHPLTFTILRREWNTRSGVPW